MNTVCNNLNIMCWNIEGVMSGTPYLLKCLEDRNIDICGLSEHWIREYNLSFFDTFIHSGYSSIVKPVHEIDPFRFKCNIRGGVCILYKSNLNIQEITTDSPRIVGAEVQVSDDNYIYVFSVYMPASSRHLDVFNETLDILESLVSVYTEKGRVMIIGDLNVKISGPRYHFSRNNRSTLFETFLKRNNLVSVNVQSDCKGPEYTFCPVTEKCTMIDHIILEASMLDLVEKSEVLDECVINTSEHLPVLCSVGIPTVPIKKCACEFVKYNWRKAVNSDQILNYKSVVDFNLRSITILHNTKLTVEIDIYYESLKSVLLKASKLCIQECTFNKHLKPYWNDELKNIHCLMLLKRKLWKDSGQCRGNDVYFLDYKSCKTIFRSKLRHAFNEYMRLQFEEIDRCGEVDQTLFWQLYKSKSYKSKFIQTEMKYDGQVLRDPEEIVQAWATHFRKLFDNEPNETFDVDTFNQVSSDLKSIEENIKTDRDIFLEKEFTFEEVSNVCKSLKTKKSGGPDGLVYEHVKYCNSLLVTHMTHLFNLIIKNEYIPKSWKLGMIITIYKGNGKPKDDPNSFRGITLIPVFFKIFETLLSTRLSPVLESDTFPNKHQSAYRKKLCSLCTSFNLQESVNYNLDNGSDVFVAFLDSSKAFDTVWQEGLLVKLYNIGIKGKIWNILKNMYSYFTSHVVFNGFKSDNITMKRGILQGGSLSAKMYLVFINDLLNEVESSGKGSLVLASRVNIPTQADDICLISNNVHSLQHLISTCESYSRKWRFIFSSTKSKIVVFTPKKKLHFSCDLFLYGMKLPIVDSIVHVGVLLNGRNNNVERTERTCVKLKCGVMSLIRSGAHPCALNPLTIAKIVKCKVYPSALYGCELWQLKQSEIYMLEKAQNFIVKSMQGFNFRTRTDMCTSLIGWFSIEAYISVKKMLFLGRICRMDVGYLTREIFIKRLFEFNLSHFSRGFIPDIVNVLQKYNLFYVLNEFLNIGVFPNKSQWKILVNDHVKSYEQTKLCERMNIDTDFSRFILLHNKIQPYSVWKLALRFPQYSVYFKKIVKLSVEMRNNESIYLCQYCGLMYQDIITHSVLECSHTEILRDRLWCVLSTLKDVDFFILS